MIKNIVLAALMTPLLALPFAGSASAQRREPCPTFMASNAPKATPGKGPADQTDPNGAGAVPTSADPSKGHAQTADATDCSSKKY
jgi:hypothetical protein